MRPVYFLVGHPFGDPANEETIFEGPLSTREIADNALDAHLSNGGQPARVACLAERTTTKLNLGKPVWLASIDSTKAGV